MIRLHDHVLSGCCYKVRLLLALLDLPYEKVAVDLYPGEEQRSPDFLAFSRFGRLPVLTEGKVRLADAQAILVYLAARHDPARRWYPADAEGMGEVGVWLGFAAGELMSAAAAREFELFGAAAEIGRVRGAAEAAFRLLDDHVTEREYEGGRWLVGLDHPTIADVACFPYVALAEDAGVRLDECHALRRWVRRVKGLRGFVTMPGVLAF